MPYHVFRHLSAITAVRPKPNDVRCAYQIPWWLTPQAPWNVVNLELREAGGREGRVGQRGQKEILPEGDPNEGEALKRGREGGEGRGRGAVESFTWGQN